MSTRSIPVYEFGPSLMAHHTHGMLASSQPFDARQQAVLPGHPEDDYRATPASIAFAKAEAARERQEVDAQIAGYQIRKETALNTLTAMVAEHGYPLVEAWLQHVRRSVRP